MRCLGVIVCLLSLLIPASCSNNEGPDYHVFMQPSSINTTDADGDNQTFEYDEYGRIVRWTLKSNIADDQTSYTARFYYPDDKTIEVKSEELLNNQTRFFEESISLVNGRASKSEGTFISHINDNMEVHKTYRLEFSYDLSNHLNVVKHSEISGIGDEIENNAWDNSWTWENYLIWEDGNLKEFQDFSGNSTIYRTTKFEYSIYATGYPVIIPTVINSAHHLPLCMQGVFGPNSINLVKSASTFDNVGNMCLSRQYSYEFDQARIVEFTATTFTNSVFSNLISYKVNWTEK